MTFGQFMILGIGLAALASALVVRYLLYGLMRRAILAYWERHPHPSNPYRGFKWLPLYGVCIALLGAAWLYFSVLRHV